MHEEARDTTGSMLELLDEHDTPFLRDAPFGSPTAFAGETPFHQGGTAFELDCDDVEGIPTGLPDLLDLSSWPTHALDTPSGAPDEIDTERAAPVRHRRPIRRLAPFLGGLVFASAGWSLFVVACVPIAFLLV